MENLRTGDYFAVEYCFSCVSVVCKEEGGGEERERKRERDRERGREKRERDMYPWNL